MGREIRRVPPNWDHPKKSAEWSYFKQREEVRYQPLYDRCYPEAITEWIEGHQKWEAGQDQHRSGEYRYYAQYYGGPPDVEYYRPDWKPEEMAARTGRPCIMECGPWSREAAERFVRGGMSLPSLVIAYPTNAEMEGGAA